MNIKNVTSRIACLLAGDTDPYPQPAGELVAGLLSAHNEQLALLQGLGSPVDLLDEGSWQTARLHLRETLLPGCPAGHVTAALTRAASRLRDAAEQQPPESFQRAQVLADLAIVARLRRERRQAGGYARDAYWLARRAMGSLVGEEFGGEIPAGPHDLARLSTAGAVYDSIEWSAAAVGDPAAARVVSAGDGGTRWHFGSGRVVWAGDGELDFGYIAYFQLLQERAASADAVGPGPTTIQRALWQRFRDQGRLRSPRHPPLPPPALLEDGGAALRELQLLVSAGRL